MSIKEALAVLGLDPSATPSEIRAVYHDLVKVWHPDRYVNQPELCKEAEVQLQKINLAHWVLRDYDSERSITAQETAPASRVANRTRVPKEDTFVVPKERSYRGINIAVALCGVAAVVELAMIRFSQEDYTVPYAATTINASSSAGKDAGVRQPIDVAGRRSTESHTLDPAPWADDASNAAAMDTAVAVEPAGVPSPTARAAVGTAIKRTSIDTLTKEKLAVALAKKPGPAPGPAKKPAASAPVTKAAVEKKPAAPPAPVAKAAVKKKAVAHPALPKKEAITAVAATKPPNAISPQAFATTHAVVLSAFSGLDDQDRRSIEAACLTQADTKSVPTYRACLIRELRKKPRAIHLE